MLFLKVNKLKAKIKIISNLLFENWSGKKRLRRCLFELRVGFHCEVLISCSRWYEETQRLASHQRQLPNWTLWALNRKRILGANLFFAASMTGSSYLCGRGGASRCRSTEEWKEPLDWHHSYLCCLWSKLLRLAPCCPARKCWAIIGKYGGWQWCRLFSNFDWKWGVLHCSSVLIAAFDWNLNQMITRSQEIPPRSLFRSNFSFWQLASN